MIKISFHFIIFSIVSIAISCSSNPTPQIIIDNKKFQKETVWDGFVRGGIKNIQLTNLRPSQNKEIAIIGQTGVYFLLPNTYELIDTQNFATKSGETIWFGLTPKLIDANNDGKYEIVKRGSGFGDVGLLSFSGEKLWAFKPDPDLNPDRMLATDLDGDHVQEFYAAGSSGLYRLDGAGNIIWQIKTKAETFPLFCDIEVLNNNKTNKKQLLALNNNTFYVINAEGKILREFVTDYRLSSFGIIYWNGDTYILTGYFDNKVVFIDLSGKTVFEIKFNNFPLYHEPQGTAVNFVENEKEYIAVLVHSRSSIGLSQLTIISPDKRIEYQEILSATNGLLSVEGKKHNSEVLLIGDGPKKVLEFSIRN